jgi:lysozyme
MNLSQAGLTLLKRSEGFRSKTYLDVAGFPTIGYGHKIVAPESYPQGITEAYACKLLSADVYCAEKSVARLVKVPLSQGQFDALVDFTFNLGAGRLASSTLLAQLNAANYDVAAHELLKWDHAGHKELAALKARREAEYKLWTGKEAA